MLGIDIDPLHLAKAFLTENNSPAANGLALCCGSRAMTVCGGSWLGPAGGCSPPGRGSPAGRRGRQSGR
ncbi:hypothetical protein J4734_12715 [Klebsiella pneumoniae]|uniref:Uncharacterized protein n=1 Tax=Klebsiella pneumoniae TaxID=573 RepID=A0A939SW42_KLEPN|nr:hypothetical protein [Klebsiella pneumoniae]